MLVFFISSFSGINNSYIWFKIFTYKLQVLFDWHKSSGLGVRFRPLKNKVIFLSSSKSTCRVNIVFEILPAYITFGMTDVGT